MKREEGKERIHEMGGRMDEVYFYFTIRNSISYHFAFYFLVQHSVPLVRYSIWLIESLELIRTALTKYSIFYFVAIVHRIENRTTETEC